MSSHEVRVLEIAQDSQNKSGGLEPIGTRSEFRRRADRRARDPLRFHGAWVYLTVAVAAGAFLENGYGVERGLLAGTGFVGGFMFVGGFAWDWRRRRRQALVGASLALGMPIGAILLGGPKPFLGILVVAAILAIVILAIARQQGFVAASSVAVGTATLALAAPTVALAAGASASQAAALYGLLWPFFWWRTGRVSHDLRQSDRLPSARIAMRQRGLREAALAAVWGLLAVAVVRWMS